MSAIASEGMDERGLAQQKVGIRLPAKPAVIMIILTAVALVYWSWFGLTQKTIITDDGISILAAKRILEHGYPLMPSGEIYHRGYVANYLVAGSIQIFGLNDFAIMLPGLVLGLASLWLMYIFAKHVLGNSWVGVGAAVIAPCLTLVTFYSTSPRMYGPFMFLSLFAAYSAWRGYYLGERKFQLLAPLVVGAAILNHRVAMLLLIAIPAALLMVLYLRSGKLPRLNAPSMLVCLLLVCAAGVVIYLASWILPSHIGAIKVVVAGLDFDVLRWLKQVYVFDQALPLALGFMPAVLFVALKSLRLHGQKLDIGLVYCILICSISGLLLIVLNPIITSGGRQWLFLLPLIIVCLLYYLGVAGPSILANQRQKSGRYLSVTVFMALLLGGLAVNLGAELFAGAQPLRVIQAAYGLPCQGGSCDPSGRKQYQCLSSLVAPGDLIISSNPHVTSYYLGRVDRILRERRQTEQGSVVWDYNSDAHLDIPTISSAAELEDLSRSPIPVWVIVDRKLHYVPESELQSVLSAKYFLVNCEGTMSIYANADPGSR